jgi:hypothetical protein
MRKVIEYTLVSADGAFDDPVNLGFMQYQDDAYMRDGLGLLTACDAMLFGRSTYQIFAKLYQDGRAHPRAGLRLTAPTVLPSARAAGVAELDLDGEHQFAHADPGRCDPSRARSMSRSMEDPKMSAWLRGWPVVARAAARLG